MNFNEYLKLYAEEDSRLGDFARDALNDPDFPEGKTRALYQPYMEEKHPCTGCMEAFEELWKQYELNNR